MFFLAAATVTGGLTAVALLTPISPLVALIAAPFAGSAATLLAAAYLGSRKTSAGRIEPDLDAQTNVMAAALREVAERAEASPRVPEADSAGQKAA